MKWLVLLLLLTLTVKYILWGMAVSELRGDAVVAPSLSQLTDVQPENMKFAMLKVMSDRGCDYVQDSLHITVGPSEPIPLNVAAPGVHLQSKGNTQRIDIAFRCRRSGPFFFEKEVVVDVSTRARGDGNGGVYPAAPQQDAHPH